jgi:hypothetical protein
VAKEETAPIPEGHRFHPFTVGAAMAQGNDHRPDGGKARFPRLRPQDTRYATHARTLIGTP